MKKLLLGITMLISLICTQAQNLSKGDKVMGFGIGLASYHASNEKIVFPPIRLSLDYCVKDHLFDAKSSLSLGAYVGYFGGRSEISTNWGVAGYKYSNFNLGARGGFHYNFIPQLDTYAGLLLGYTISSASKYGATFDKGNDIVITESSKSRGGPFYSVYFGARYDFSRNFGTFVELGYGLSVLELGISYRFR